MPLACHPGKFEGTRAAILWLWVLPFLKVWQLISLSFFIR